MLSGSNSAIGYGGSGDFEHVIATGNWWGDSGGPHNTSNADGRINDNPAGHPAGDWVDYDGWLSARPQVGSGPYVVGVQASSAPLNGLWAGEGNASDRLGNLHGTLRNGATFAPGKVGQAFWLDGVDDSVDLGAWNPGSRWTLAAWVNASDLPAGRRAIVGGMNDCADWALVLSSGEFGLAIRQPGGCTLTLGSGVRPAANEWHYVVGTNDGATARLYVDGELKASTPVEPGYVGTSNRALIGAEQCCGNFFPGLIDEVRIVGRTLSADQVRHLFETGELGESIQFNVRFSDAIRPDTFTLEDLEILGPAPVAAHEVRPLDAKTYQIAIWPAPTAEGQYTVRLGPALESTAGLRMDQDRDGTVGETPDDIYEFGWTIDRTGARVVAQTPSGTSSAAVDRLEVAFSEPIQSSSFTRSDTAILERISLGTVRVPGFFVLSYRASVDVANGGLSVTTVPTLLVPARQVLAVKALSPTLYRLEFEAITRNGDYAVRVGPDILDLAGNRMDQDGDGVVGDSYLGAFSIRLEPLRIVSHEPAGVIGQGTDRLDVTFSVPIVPASFGALDVRLVGPAGRIPIRAVQPMGETRYRVWFDTVTAEGMYTALIGPDIRDAAGRLMDQDGDGTPGEPEDRYEARFQIDEVGPAIVAQSVVGTVAAPVTALELTFSEPVRASTFTPVDVRFTGPNGTFGVTDVVQVSPVTFRLLFLAQSATGDYSFTVGPHILDLAGVPMNQDGDALDGEELEDVYTGTFAIDNTGPRIVSHTPAGTLEAPFARVTLEFSEPVWGDSFDLTDVQVVGPQGALAVGQLERLDATHYRLSFAAQTVPGNYRFTVGPQIADAVGNRMDQNGNGMFGEPADTYVFVLTLALPNLEVLGLTVPDSVAAGSSLTVNWTVGNSGGLSAQAPWTDRVVLSRDEFLGNLDDLVLGSPAATTNLAPGGNYLREVTATVPWGAQGAYTLFLELDAGQQLLEGNETDNVLSRPVRVEYARPPADLRVEAVTIPATAGTGQELTASWRVTNYGTAPTEARAWSDRVYLSADETFGNDVVLGTFAHGGALGALGNYGTVQKVMLPEDLTAGLYTVFVVTDVLGQVLEPGGEDNNVAASLNRLNVTLSPVPDLTVAAVTGPATANVGQTVTVHWTLRNAGGASLTRTWKDRVYLSTDGTLNGAAQLGTFEFSGTLAVGGERARQAHVTLPAWTDGDYRLVVVTDAENQVFERDQEDNNLGVAAAPVRLTHPDLVVQDIGPIGNLESGSSFPLEWTVRNVGTGPSPSRWTEALFLSVDPVLSAQDVLLLRREHPGALEAGQAAVRTEPTVALPDGLAGTYYVLVQTDAANEVAEGAGDNNNVGASTAFEVALAPYADLRTSAVTAPPLLIGDPVDLTVSWTVSNEGTGAGRIDRWVDRVLLSADTVVGNGDDRNLGQFEHFGLMPVGTQYTETRVITLPSSLQGRFHVFVVADAVWDIGDRLIGVAERGTEKRPVTLGPGESYHATLATALPVALPANYRVIVRADIYDDIHEGAFNRNNTRTSADVLEVTVTTLTLGVPLEDTLAANQARLYRVQVPAGETLEVVLDSDLDNAANEVFLRIEALPDSIRYDAAYPGHLWADQTVLVPATQRGFYYVLVRATGSGPTQTIELRARLLPFGITEVRPDTGGDSRYVTVRIAGAKFDPAATVKLIRPQFAEHVPVNYLRTSATEIVAVFDLRDAVHGLYDVQVTNPNGQVSRVPYRYLVEDALPLDLAVGLGGPARLELGEVGWYGVGIYSLTNVDAPYVHLEFGLPRLPQDPTGLIPGEKLVFRTNLSGQPRIDQVPWVELDPIVNLGGHLMAPGFTFDFVNRGYAALTFTADTYPALREILAEDPDFLKNLFDFELEALAFDFYIQAAATPMTTAEYLKYQRGQAETLRGRILSDTTAPQGLRALASDAQTWGNLFLAALTDTGLLRAQDEPPEIRDRPEFASLMSVLAAGLLGGPRGGEIIAAGSLVDFFNQVRRWYGHDPEATGSAAIPPFSQFDLGLTYRTHYAAFRITVGERQQVTQVPVDLPNLGRFFGLTGARSDSVFLSGPNGFGDLRFVPADQPLPYTISFENPATATAPVSQVRILEALDPNVDPRSFRLGDIRLGDLVVHLPPNRAAFTGEFDLRAERGIFLQVTAGLDVNTNLVTWLLTAVDPLTGLPATDPTLGLLFPNVDRTQGGSVHYTIKANPDAPTGAEIAASARILYGNAAPLDTNVVTHTLDAVAPTSQWTATRLANGSYALSWSATDDPSGSGVKDYSVFTSVNGEPFNPWLRQTTETSAVFEAQPGTTVAFVVLAADAAGNLEAPPAGVALPLTPAGVNLGAPPTAPETTPAPLPTTTPPGVPATNPLFTQALLQIPNLQGRDRPSSFRTVFEPFTAAGFALRMPQSGAGIGPLGLAFAPDGETVYVSGGRGRNALYRFGVGGGEAGAPLAVLDEPVYDLAFDADGWLWATSGGGSLLQIDPATGQIADRFGQGIELGLAYDAATSTLYLSTRDGIATFQTRTRTFSSYASTRVHSLALAPDGTLWATTWPNQGQVVRFDRLHRPEVMATFEDAPQGLAFGQPGTQLDGLLFVSHTGGALTLVDLVSLESVPIATGGGRSEFIKVGPGGRLYATSSAQVDVFFPVLPPQVIATSPPLGAEAVPIVNRATVTFNAGMLTGADPGAVSSLTHYALTDLNTGRPVTLGAAVYDPATRTVELSFEPLPPDEYELRVRATLESDLGVRLERDHVTQFVVLQELTDTLTPEFSHTRYDRAAGTVAFEVSLTNALPFNLQAPIRIVFAGLGSDAPSSQAAAVSLLEPDGQTDTQLPYLDLHTAPDTLLAPGATLTRTVVLRNPTGARVDLEPRVLASVSVNLRPTYQSTPANSGAVAQEYRYAPQAVDPDGTRVWYVLREGPAGVVFEAETGLIRWTPAAQAAARAAFELRAYDARGGYTAQAWTVNVTGANAVPVLFPIANQQIAEGEWLELPVAAFDPDDQPLVFGVDRLPPGALFDGRDNVLRWRPDSTAAGRYPGIEVFVSDGLARVSRTFEILVLNVNQPPQLELPAAQVVRENDELRFTLEAHDPDGDRVWFTAANLPVGATLAADDGLFVWRPNFTQHGSYQLQVAATDGTGVTASDSMVLRLTILDHNAPPVVAPIPNQTVAAGQSLEVTIAAADSENSPLTLTVTGLPPFATFTDRGNGTGRIRANPSPTDRGNFVLTVRATDDGNGNPAAALSGDYTFVLTAQLDNAQPVLELVPDQIALVDQELIIPVRVIDLDEDPLTYTASGLPANATFRPTSVYGLAELRWRPSSADLGSHDIALTVADDGHGNPANALRDTRTVRIHVRPTNAAPLLEPIGRRSAPEGQTLTFTLRATDADADPFTS